MLSDIGVERALIAGLCQHGKDAYIDVSDLIDTHTFTTDYNQALYKCIQYIHDNANVMDLAELAIAAEHLNLNNILFSNKKDLEYVRSIFNFPVKLANVREYAVRLEKLRIARIAQEKLKYAHDQLSEIKGTETIDHILGLSEGPIFDLVDEVNRGKDTGPHLITENSDEILQELIENPNQNIGLPTPWPCYNAAIGHGLRRGGVNLIASRPKLGKTTLAKEAILHWTQLKIPCLFLDTEMVQKDQLFRALSSLSGVDLYKIETGNFSINNLDKQKVLEANELLKNNPYFWYESICGKPFEEILSIIRRWIIKNVGYDDAGEVNNCVVVYDYFKLMGRDDLGNLKEYEALGYQISKLTDFCKEYDFACLAFVQLNRQQDISQSDRLRWLAHSVSWFERKDETELLNDGIERGNRKLQPRDMRFGPGIGNDYINMQLYGDINKIEELGLNSQARDEEDTGFELQSGSDQRETD